MRPRIGISCNSGLLEETKLPTDSHYQNYARGINDAGGIPIFVPLDSDPTLFDTSLSQLDGLLLPGGCDLHPDFYGDDSHPLLGKCNRQLDQLDLALARWALQNDIPTFGICRGMQVINVALGGTLYQDLGDQYPGSKNHRQRGVSCAHSVYVEHSSQMEKFLGTRELWVNSRHHQAVKMPGEGVIITGYAEDGVAELLEVSGYRFMMAVQCHPEEIYTHQPAFARLFTTFVEACAMPLAYTSGRKQRRQ